MLDPKLIRNNPDTVREALRRRGDDAGIVDQYLRIDELWRKASHEVDSQKAERNSVSDKIGELKKNKKNADDLVAETKKISDKIKAGDEELKALEENLRGIALLLPNIPHIDVPEGKDGRDNLEIRSWGKKKFFGFVPSPHFEIGTELGILDFDSAAKVSGSRFATILGKGALLERALINFMLDTHTKEHGYTEVWAPFIVNRLSMFGTGQLPKFEEDLFRLKDEDLYLIPTAEVSVTNLHREEILDGSRLPLKYVSYSPCFRREAGSYGKDVRGLIRQHQFNKVELVKFVEPEASYKELESLTADAEAILQKLGLHYRVVVLCTGDIGFAAAKTYDIEVWFPSEEKHREISSCSNFSDFQARRANIRSKKGEGKPEFVHTLNGSGLAVGRTFAAILENYQKEDGTIEI
ncbi:MAG: serine--tRNA ligase, partial [Candidatus Saganbacteria bacterium]|nr:serine--tRNA ligase [Candidatus Saganbacteria bacterium]